MPNIKKLERENKTFRIEYIFQENNEKILFIAPCYSGKTSLLKYIYLLLLKKEIYPLYIYSKYIVKTKYFEEDLKKCFKEQYNGDFNVWNGLPVYVLIDDYTHSVNDKFIHYLRENLNCNKIIITIEEDEYLAFFRDFPEFSNFKKFQLRPFNSQQRETIVKKWLTLKDENIDLDFYNKVDIFEEKINNIISSQFILSPYPTNILLILQTLEMKTDMQITSYGYCYYTLILNYFAKNGINIDDGGKIDAMLNFLSELSFDIFKTKKEYTKKQYNTFKDKYAKKFFIDDGLIKRLENGDYPMLRIKDDKSIKFDQEFIYYYFLGKVLSEKITKEDIEYFCENIHQKINMYIIVFIIHHSKNMELIDEIILRCMMIFDEINEATYLKDETHNFVDQLDMPKIIMNTESIEKNRLDERSLQDEINEELEDYEDSNDNINNELYRGMKFSEVLGQILKNRSGSFEKNKVKEIVNSIIELRLKNNYVLFEICKDKDFEKYITQTLKEFFKTNRSKKITDKQAKKFIKKLIEAISVGGSIGFINHASFLIYAENIIDSLEYIVENHKQPSREIILFLTSIRQGFKESHLHKLEMMVKQYEKDKNFFAKTILSYSIQHYLNTHQIDEKIELNVCKVLLLPKINRSADRLLKCLERNKIEK